MRVVIVMDLPWFKEIQNNIIHHEEYSKVYYPFIITKIIEELLESQHVRNAFLIYEKIVDSILSDMNKYRMLDGANYHEIVPYIYEVVEEVSGALYEDLYWVFKHDIENVKFKQWLDATTIALEVEG